MLVKHLIEILKKCDQNAVVVCRAYEDGSVVKEVIDDIHTSILYWKRDSPVKDISIPTVTIGSMDDGATSINKDQYKELLAKPL